MVNGVNGNYSVQGVSYNPPLYNTGNNVAGNNQQVNYNSNDNINVNKPQSGNVPSSGKVSFWDQMSSGFKDIHQSPQNINAYKVFQNAVKSNPEGHLLPGSSDTNKVKDLQQKLSMVGFRLNVNGQFGQATEQAVVQFKKSIGINDGYLDKGGNFAVTSVVTPKTWELLNAQVAFKLNPNGYNGNGYQAPPVTQEELNWAKNLQTKIQAGYQPNQNEKIRYENIYNRQQLALQSKQDSFVPPDVPPPTPEDIEWAKQLLNKMQTLGYKPNQSEMQKYQEIYNKQKQSKISEQFKQDNPKNTNNTQPNNSVTQEELNWAKQIQQKVKSGQQISPQDEAKYEQIRQKLATQNTNNNNTGNQGVTQEELNWAHSLETKVNSQGYTPTNEEKTKYEDIFSRYQAHGVQGGNTDVSKGVTQEELNWAKSLETKVNSQGYTPTNEEKTKYEDIFSRYQKDGLKSEQTGNTTAPKKPSEKDLEWALDLEKRTQEGYQPSEMELQMYNDILSRYQYHQQQEKNSVNGATPDEMSWAANMYTKMQGGYKPSAEELSILNNIQSKISGGSNNNSGNNVTSNNNTSNRPKMDFNPQGDFSYSGSNIQAFREAFSNYSFAGNRVPYLSSEDGNNVARQYGFSSVEDLQSSVGASVDGKFGPETYFKLAQYLNNGGVPSSNNRVNNNNSTQSYNNVTNNNSGNVSGGVTQEELDWAVNMQSRYSQGYKPSKEEMDKYTDIYNRYEASGNKIVSPNNNTSQTNFNTTSSNPPTQEELTWAQNLQDKVTNQGYKATQQEMDKYTDIFTRYQASQGQVNTNTNTNNTTQVNTNNTPTVSVNVGNNDPDLQWALQLLDRVQNQGYNPTEQEIQKYEQIVAKNQSVATYP